MSTQKPLIQHTLWVAPSPMGGRTCNLYLILEPMRPGQSPSNLYDRLGSTWKKVGQIEQVYGNRDAPFTIVSLEPELARMKEDLRHTMGGTFYTIIQKEDGSYCYPEDVESRPKPKPERTDRGWDNEGPSI